MREAVRRMEPLSDSVFSFMFSDPAMKLPLKEIINSVLLSAGDTQIEDVQEFRTQFDLPRRAVNTHGGRVDVRAKATDGSVFDLEVQLHTERAMNARTWFYGSRLMDEEFPGGLPYGSIPKVRVINILDFALRGDHWDFLQPIKLMYVKNPEEATDAFRIYNIELTKFRKLYPTLESVKDDPLLRWLYLLDKGYADKQEMEVLSGMTEGMLAFATKYKISLDDPELKELYDYEMSARSELASAIEQAESKGEERGIQIGAKNAEESMIRSMYVNGIPLDTICKTANRTLSEVNTILGLTE